MMNRLPTFRLLAVTVLGFALTLTANILEPSVLGHKMLQLVPGKPSTALGFTTLAGLLLAVLVQPVVGAYSDRTQSPWGRRLPYMVGGASMVALSLYLIAVAPVLGLVVTGVLLLQLFSNTVQGPWQALIPDQVPEAQRGRASGLKALFDILAFVTGRAVAGFLMSRLPRWGETALIAAVSVAVAVYVIALAITAVGARESPGAVAASPAKAQTPAEALRGAFAVDFQRYPAFRWWFANRLLFWSAFIALNTFLLFYAMNVLGLTEAGANAFIGRLSLVLGGMLALVSIPAGWLADRVGRKPLVVASGLAAAAGTLFILVGRTPALLTIGAGIIGLSIGTFLSASWALATDIVPGDQAARYLGIANIAAAGGSALARFLGGVLIDPLNLLFGSSSAGYLAVYAIAASFFLLSAIVALPLRAGKPSAPVGEMLRSYT